MEEKEKKLKTASISFGCTRKDKNNNGERNLISNTSMVFFIGKNRIGMKKEKEVKNLNNKVSKREYTTLTLKVGY